MQKKSSPPLLLTFCFLTDAKYMHCNCKHECTSICNPKNISKKPLYIYTYYYSDSVQNRIPEPKFAYFHRFLFQTKKSSSFVLKKEWRKAKKIPMYSRPVHAVYPRIVHKNAILNRLYVHTSTYVRPLQKSLLLLLCSWEIRPLLFHAFINYRNPLGGREEEEEEGRGK